MVVCVLLIKCSRLKWKLDVMSSMFDELYQILDAYKVDPIKNTQELLNEINKS